MPSAPSEQTSFTLRSLPGVRRDGTRLDNPYYNAAIWTRFQRGQPRKIGGYQLMSSLVSGPVRELHVNARSIGNTIHSFSSTGIEQLAFDNDGIGGGVNVRTPAGFVSLADYTWQSASMFSNGGGGQVAIIAAATPDADNIADETEGPVYSANVQGTSLFTVVSDGAPISVSGGCCVLQPFLFVYGNNGLIRNSNANDFSAATGWTGGDSNSANVAGSKIVKGLPTRGGGNSPAGLFWALDALIRVSYIAGTLLWRYDTVSSAISVLAKNAIVEYDGVYYWPGVDRFFLYNGVVQELPNDMNLNFFYDHINPQARNKCWAMKIPRFGEIWWFFPMGDSMECNHAVVLNVREKTWYDTPLIRSAGAPPQIFTLPIMAGGDARVTKALTLSGRVGDYAVGQVITGGTSGATGVILRWLGDYLNVEVSSGAFIAGEVVTTTSATAVVNGTPIDQALDSIWLHEKGLNRIYKQDVTAISAEFETTSFQWMNGGPPGGQVPAGPILQTRLARLEPDFVMKGSMTMRVNGRAYAQSDAVLSGEFRMEPDTAFVDTREQRREMSLVFRSNEIDGDFQAGRLQVTTEPGDVRG
jgi:hypothetical protein